MRTYVGAGPGGGWGSRSPTQPQKQLYLPPTTHVCNVMESQKESLERLLADFKLHLSSPEAYSHPTEELKSRNLEALKSLFRIYKNLCAGELGNLEKLPGCRHVDTGPLSELYTEGLDNDQIWEQIQLVNRPVLRALTGVMADASRKYDRGEFRLLAHSCEPEKELSEEGEGDEGEEDVEEEGESEGDEIESHFSGEDEEGDGEEGGKVMGKKSVVDDRFFKLSEMEKFLEEAEREESKGMKPCLKPGTFALFRMVPL